MRRPRSSSEFGFDRYDPLRLRKAIEQVEDKRSYARLQGVLLIARGMLLIQYADYLDGHLNAISLD